VRVVYNPTINATDLSPAFTNPNDPMYDERAPMQFWKYNRYEGIEDICKRILDILLDTPYKMNDGSVHQPYQTGARADFCKLLYYDTMDALSQPRPTTAQMTGLVYNPEREPDDKLRDYRIFGQARIVDLDTLQGSELRMYPYKLKPVSEYYGEMYIVMDYWANTRVATLNGYRNRAFEAAHLILKILSGRYVKSVGTIYFNKTSAGINYSEIIGLDDGRQNIGYRLIMGINYGSGN